MLAAGGLDRPQSVIEKVVNLRVWLTIESWGQRAKRLYDMKIDVRQPAYHHDSIN